MIEFKNEDDCWYFLNVDQAYQDFVEHINPHVEDFLALDFTPGMFRGHLRLQW